MDERWLYASVSIAIFALCFGLFIWLIVDGHRKSARDAEQARAHLGAYTDALTGVGLVHTEEAPERHRFEGVRGGLPVRFVLARVLLRGWAGVRLTLRIAPDAGLRVPHYIGISHDRQDDPALDVASARARARDQGVSRADTGALDDEVMALVVRLLNRAGGSLMLTRDALEWQLTWSLKDAPDAASALDLEALMEAAAAITGRLSAAR